MQNLFCELDQQPAPLPSVSFSPPSRVCKTWRILGVPQPRGHTVPTWGIELLPREKRDCPGFQ